MAGPTTEYAGSIVDSHSLGRCLGLGGAVEALIPKSCLRWPEAPGSERVHQDAVRTPFVMNLYISLHAWGLEHFGHEIRSRQGWDAMEID